MPSSLALAMLCIYLSKKQVTSLLSFHLLLALMFICTSSLLTFLCLYGHSSSSSFINERIYLWIQQMGKNKETRNEEEQEENYYKANPGYMSCLIKQSHVNDLESCPAAIRFHANHMEITPHHESVNNNMLIRLKEVYTNQISTIMPPMPIQSMLIAQIGTQIIENPPMPITRSMSSNSIIKSMLKPYTQSMPILRNKSPMPIPSMQITQTGSIMPIPKHMAKTIEPTMQKNNTASNIINPTKIAMTNMPSTPTIMPNHLKTREINNNAPMPTPTLETYTSFYFVEQDSGTEQHRSHSYEKVISREVDHMTESTKEVTQDKETLRPIIETFDETFDWEEGDIFIFPTDEFDLACGSDQVFTAYKRVDQKIHPVSGTFPEQSRVDRRVPEDPLKSLPTLTCHPPDFRPTERLTNERIMMINVNENNFLWPEEEKLFKNILRLNENALAFEDKHRGILKNSYFSDYIMPTIPHTPWEYKNIPIPPGIKDKVIDLLKNKIEAGVYEQSQSSYRCRWFCVLKKNGTLRMIHDLQPLNKVSIRDAGLLPIVDDFVEPFAARQCYTVFDLFWGFDARIVHPQSRDLTAFYTPLGLLRLTCLPMGYTNSPAEFQKCMTFVLQDEIPETANIFIDDLPIKGPATQYLQKDGKPEVLLENPGIRRFIWEHAQDVHRVMHRINCVGATFSPKKTQICRPKVVIVGITCSPEGRSPDSDRIAKVLKWPTLTSLKEVRGFLGLCGTVRIWIENYSKLARPLTELYHKDIEFEWTERREEAFNRLKVAISTAPALRPIDYRSGKSVILSVDTSYIAVGFILSQIDENGKRRPARYGSLPMNETEARYSQAKLELYGLFRALRHWRLYIIGVTNFIVEVDAKYIKGILNNPDLQPDAAMNRWIQGILLFDFALNHVPGVEFKGPDALSRRQPLKEEQGTDYDDSWLDDIALLNLIPDKSRFKDFCFTTHTKLPYKPTTLPSSKSKLSKQDLLLFDIQEFLVTLKIPIQDPESLQARKRFMKKATQFFLKEDRMFKRNGTHTPLLVVISPQKRVAILTQAHENLGHKGEQAVYDLVRHRFYWPYLRTDVHHHVASCHECQIRNLKKMQVPVTISTPASLFEKVYVDVMYMPPSGQYRFIVAAKDDLSGVVEASPLRHNNSESLAKFFWEKIFCRYGAMGQIVTDNGPEVKGAFEILMRRMGVPQVHISPYNKHANGVIERGHYILREAIVKSCEKDQFGKIKNWHKQVEPAVFADRVTVSSVTGYSPFELLHGMPPLLPFDLTEATFMVDGFHSGMSTSDLLSLRIRQLQKRDDDLARAAETVKKTRLRSKQQFHKRYVRRLQKDTYDQGELVLVRNTRLEMTVTKFKTEPRYLGPYEVVRKTKGGSYILKELDGAIHAQNYAAHRLIPYIQRDDPILQELADKSDPEEEIFNPEEDMEMEGESDHMDTDTEMEDTSSN
jgi:hypothetical protein